MVAVAVSYKMLLSKLEYKLFLDESTPPTLPWEQSECPHIWFPEENREQAPGQMGNIGKKEQSGRMEDCGRTWGR